MTRTAGLEQLDEQIDRVLITGNEDTLPILGYGEINLVLQWPGPEGLIAVKRLPLFDSDARLSMYRAQFDEYIATLRARNINVIESRLETIERRDGYRAAYCIQPALSHDTLLPEILRSSNNHQREEIFSALSRALATAISAQVGLDAQVSNWGLNESGLIYLDVTAPMLRGDAGRDRLDSDLFIASFPAEMRPLIRKLLLKRILNPYFSPRSAALDLIANLYKEDLEPAIPLAIDICNNRLSIDLSIDEARRFYRHDAWLWGFGQWVRRLDRTWQRHVRRRPYPFLLPGRIPR